MPPILYWLTRTPGVVLVSVFGPIADIAEARDKDGCKAAHLACRRYRPWGVIGWRTQPEERWRDMDSCPVPESRRDVQPGGVEGRPQMSKYGR